LAAAGKGNQVAIVVIDILQSKQYHQLFIDECVRYVDKIRRDGAGSEASRAFIDHELFDGIEKDVMNLFSDTERLKTWCGLIQGIELPKSLWIDIMAAHAHRFEKAAEELGPKLEELSRRIGKKVIETEAHFVDAERCETILRDTPTVLVDGLAPDIESIGGYYDFVRGYVGFSETVARLPNVDVAQVLAHEYLHAFSGRTKVRAMPTNKPEEAGTFTIRFGLQFEGTHGNIFTWLNEAVTEYITDEVIPPAEGIETNYQEYRSILDFLLHGGTEPISFDLFKRAYFEDYDPDARPNAISAWKELQAAIDHAHGPGYLVKVDKLIKEKGATAALEELRAEKK
jgi:hypothetical protein